MTDPETTTSDSTAPRRARVFPILMILVSASLLAAGSFLACNHGHGFGHRGHGFEDPEEAREHLERHAGWALGRIDASDAQKDRIVEILGGSLDELYGLRERHRRHHDELVGLFTAPEIDRDAIEALRTQELALLDEASAALATSLADVAEVLTPEQRAELREWAEHHHRW